ncbi:MAG: AbrB family transcriptional regulator, partial [Micromonosporaceae bacterium]
MNPGTGRPENGKAGRRRARWLLGGELLVAGVVGGGLSAATGQPVIWVLGGVIGGWLACRLARALRAPAEPSPRVRQLGQLLIGAAIGPGIAAQQFSVSAGDLTLLSAGVAATLLASLLVTRAYCRFGAVDGLTAGMAMLPGGIGIMPSVAAEHGKPVGLVAIVQSARMTLVLVMALAVFGASGMVHGNGAAHGSAVGSGAAQTKALLPGSAPGWLYVAVLLAGAVAAAWAAGKLRIPVPTLLGPLLFGCALSLGLRAGGAEPDLLAAPFLQEIVGQVMLGITVGEYLAQRYVGGVVELL